MSSTGKKKKSALFSNLNYGMSNQTLWESNPYFPIIALMMKFFPSLALLFYVFTVSSVQFLEGPWWKCVTLLLESSHVSSCIINQTIFYIATIMINSLFTSNKYNNYSDNYICICIYMKCIYIFMNIPYIK